MPTEIERKFLLASDEWRQQAGAGEYYRQGYLNRIGENGQSKSSVRVRIAGDKANLNIKGATLGIRRLEYDFAIPHAEAEELLSQLTVGSVIEKTRYKLTLGKHLWEIDEFAGDNAGLIVAEIELQSEDEFFERPDWLGKEVSQDTRYYNVCLVEHPYKDWI